MNKANWLVAPNTPVAFSIYNSLDQNWTELPGLYIFAKFLNNIWQPIYIGKTDNIRQRLNNHERYDDVIKQGCSHVHVAAFSNTSPTQLDDYETYLIKTCKPPLNTMKKW